MTVTLMEMKTNARKSVEDSYFGMAARDLQELAELVGIECEYVDGRGHVHQATDEALQSTLRAVGVDVQSRSDISREKIRIQEERWTNVIEPVLLHFPEARTPFCFPIAFPLGNSSLESIVLECRLKDERGKIQSFVVQGSTCPLIEETVIQGTRHVRIQVSLPGRFRLGYFDLMIRIKIGTHVIETPTLLIAAPKHCYRPPGRKRQWGIGVQLYSIRSRNNWGIGDFRDLERIIKTAGKNWKAATIGLQPLHILTPGLCSPYSPSSRLCWNPLYLNVEQVAEFRVSTKLQRMFRTKKFQGTLQALRENRLVDYDAVHVLKMSVLEDLFRVFKRLHRQPRTSRGRGFLRFMERSPDYVTRFCTFQALSEYFHSAVWRQWPSEFHTPSSAAVEQFQKHHPDRIQFFYYVQWLCELQLTRLDLVAQKASLRLGLYHDLPVGIHPDGADAWGFQDQLAKNVTSGAPPDSFNLQGQNWGLLAPNPRALRQHGYQFFRQTLSQNMKHGGVLRIDHALGLFRMFWVPFGQTGQDGLYVKTYVDEMLAVLALESVRYKVMVVGEDLGTVTPFIQGKLEEAGLLSYRLLFFERGPGGTFHAPSQFPTQALVSATTHDLPTLKGYWAGQDIEMKKHANLYPLPEDTLRDSESREEARCQLWEALRSAGFELPESMPIQLTPELMKRVYQFLARTPSQLLMVQLEDLLGELDTPNLPGAAKSAYPSWCLRLHPELTSWLNSPTNADFSRVVSRERRNRRNSATTRDKKKVHG